MEVMVKLGVPYTEEQIANALTELQAQAKQIEENLKNDPDFVASYEDERNYARENGEEFVEMHQREIVALIAYLQRLGTDIKAESASANQ